MYGNINSIEEIVNQIPGKKIFVVCGKSSFKLSGAKEIFDKLLRSFDLKFFSDFSSNPKIEDVKKGVKLFNKFNPDIIISVGGGSTIDIAKTINIVSVNQKSSAENLVKGIDKIFIKGRPFIAIPTTAGSGSEATHFSVVYIDKLKYSLAHDFLLPDYCILDAKLTMSTPRHISASSAADALTQSIESIWSINSTEKSIDYAKEAIKLLIDNVENAVNFQNFESKQNILYGSHMAGKAINITKTTACHAISYPMTSYFGVSHGNAVALTLPELLIWNFQVTDANVNDKRGVRFVKSSILKIVDLFGCDTVDETSIKITQLLKKIGLGTSLKEFDIISREQLDLIISNVNIERMGNNPRKLNVDSLVNILSKIK